ncbi:uncharacterized protein G2W53_044642 [Senna tora]|uniref:Uncharacterized protein n=1 Tax=Senna tora TaxID=362788 RepID=A0A834SDG9_9FABA|nr:uncharacterized protein G2W53_044642 [Senna tora]
MIREEEGKITEKNLEKRRKEENGVEVEEQGS